MNSAVQLTFEGLPLDPIEVSKLLAHERSALYRELKLHPLQIAADRPFRERAAVILPALESAS